MTPIALTPAARGRKAKSRRAPARAGANAPVYAGASTPRSPKTSDRRSTPRTARDAKTPRTARAAKALRTTRAATAPTAAPQRKPRQSQGATKRTAQAASKTSSARSAGHRTTVRKSAAPRRVSGPLSGLTRTRRASEPARSAPRPARSTPRSARRGHALRAAPRGALRARTVAFVRALPDHSLLDRIVRGRAWIPILGVMLAGIVAMQVETLKLSAGTGRALERGTALESRNEQLRASVAVLGDDQRIERLAAGMGMVMPGPTTIKFLYAHQSGDVLRALNGIHQPDATTFIASLPAPAGTAATAAVAPGTTAAAALGTAAPTATGTGTTGTSGTAASATPAASTPSTVTTPAGTTAPTVTGAPATGAAAGTGTTGSAPPGATAAPTTTPTPTTPTGATAVTPGG
jgi:hypothetical protein